MTEPRVNQLLPDGGRFYDPRATGLGVLRDPPAPEPLYWRAPMRIPGQVYPTSRGRRLAQPTHRPPAASTPSPYAQPGLWDTFYLAGWMFLGLVQIRGDLGVDLDVRKHSGGDGGTIRDKGFKLGELKITLRIWDEETWASFDGMLPAIDPRRRVGRRTPVDVDHVALAQRGVYRVYIETISLPDTSKLKDEGVVEYTINAIEFHPPTGTNASRTARATPSTPDIGANRTAFTGLETPPAWSTPPSTTQAIDP